MGTKQNPGEFDAYAKALPDEPMFILLGRDANAPALILDWIMERQSRVQKGHITTTPELLKQLTEATQCVSDMLLWRQKNYGAWWGKDAAYIPPPTGSIDAGKVTASDAMGPAPMRVSGAAQIPPIDSVPG